MPKDAETEEVEEVEETEESSAENEETETTKGKADWEGWTAQDEGGIPPQQEDRSLEPVQYHPAQLPDPAAAEAAGVPPITIPEAQVNEDAANHPNGPEPGAMAVIEQRLADDNPSGAIEPEIDMEAEPGSGPEEDEEEDAGEVNLSSMNKTEIQEWADANGYEGMVDKDAMTKEQMIEAIVG